MRFFLAAITAPTDGSADNYGLAMGVLVCLGLCAYFLPSIIASRRGHKNALAIKALNLLLGWSLLGWVLSLVWALTDNTTRPRATPSPAPYPARSAREVSELLGDGRSDQ